MKPDAVIIDLDNTIVDTAVRKCGILNARRAAGEAHVGLQAVRDDFEMQQWLRSDEARTVVFRELNSPNGISDYAAPLLEGAAATLAELQRDDIHVFILTTRVEALRAVTLKELKSAGVNIDDSQLLMFTGCVGDIEPPESEIIGFKREKFEMLAGEWTILACVGDRPHDVTAAKLSGTIPLILLGTTTEAERMVLRKDVPQMQECSSWGEILRTINSVRQAIPKVGELRQMFINQYGGWLREIDEKCRITVMIAAVLIGISGKQILEENHPVLQVVLLFSLLAALFAVLYGIRAYTSRRTSGQSAGSEVVPRLKQWFGYLIGRPKRWINIDGDEMAQSIVLRKSSEPVQENAHLALFIGRYGTISAEAMLNQRLFELRASNYSKLYGERLASKLLIFSVLTIVAWIIGSTMLHRPTSQTHDQMVQEQIGDIANRLQTFQKEMEAIQDEVGSRQSADQELASMLGVLKDDLSRVERQVSKLRRTSQRNAGGKDSGPVPR